MVHHPGTSSTDDYRLRRGYRLVLGPTLKGGRTSKYGLVMGVAQPPARDLYCFVTTRHWSEARLQEPRARDIEVFDVSDVKETLKISPATFGSHRLLFTLWRRLGGGRPEPDEDDWPTGVAPTRTSPLARLSIQPPGVTGAFNQPEWQRDLGVDLTRYFRPEGCLANGDCGPATVFALENGGKVATAPEAQRMRQKVVEWCRSDAGKKYYAAHRNAEPNQKGPPLEEMVEAWAVDKEYVTQEFMTCFGGMHNVNVFMLARIIDRDGNVSCGIYIMTNGGTLVQTDKDNCVCVYYQSRWREDGPIYGHWQPVQDLQKNHVWSVSDPQIQDCLWQACIHKGVARRVVDERKKSTGATRVMVR